MAGCHPSKVGQLGLPAEQLERRLRARAAFERPGRLPGGLHGHERLLRHHLLLQFVFRRRLLCRLADHLQRGVRNLLRLSAAARAAAFATCSAAFAAAALSATSLSAANASPVATTFSTTSIATAAVALSTLTAAPVATIPIATSSIATATFPTATLSTATVSAASVAVAIAVAASLAAATLATALPTPIASAAFAAAELRGVHCVQRPDERSRSEQRALRKHKRGRHRATVHAGQRRVLESAERR